jgi:hypothetical protein
MRDANAVIRRTGTAADGQYEEGRAQSAAGDYDANRFRASLSLLDANSRSTSVGHVVARDAASQYGAR